MAQNTSISLGNHFDDFIKSKINKGRYKNVSEVVRAGLRLLEEHENKVQTLKDAIQEGADSGVAKDFNPDKFLKQLKSKRSND